MKFAIAITLFIASLITTVVLFSGISTKSHTRKITPPHSIDIKWGEGSEAGVPDSTSHN